METKMNDDLIKAEVATRTPSSPSPVVKVSPTKSEEVAEAPEDVSQVVPAADDEPTGRKLEDIPDLEIQLSIAEVLFTSHYTGDKRDGFVKALHEAITGGDSVANCAEKYEIPFVALLDYMDKLRTKLGVSDYGIKKTVSAKKRALATDEAEQPFAAPTDKKKRKYTIPGTSFRNVVIPEHWAQNEETLREIVWNIVSKCQYAEDVKKRRLNEAIMDVFITKKSMKGSAADQELPLSTVQSYFRRCRIEAERLLGPGEDAVQQSTSAENLIEKSESPEADEQEENVMPVVPPRRQQPPRSRLPAREMPTTNQIPSNDVALAQLGAAFVSSPIVQQCLAVQALMNNVPGANGPLMQLMNESLKATITQAMQSFANAVNTSNLNITQNNTLNISGIPAAPPPTPVSAVKKAAPKQSIPRPAPKDDDP